MADEPKDIAAGPGPDGTEAGGHGGGEDPPAPKTPEPPSFSVSRHPFRH